MHSCVLKSVKINGLSMRGGSPYVEFLLPCAAIGLLIYPLEGFAWLHHTGSSLAIVVVGPSESLKMWTFSFQRDAVPTWENSLTRPHTQLLTNCLVYGGGGCGLGWSNISLLSENLGLYQKLVAKGDFSVWSLGPQVFWQGEISGHPNVDRLASSVGGSLFNSGAFFFLVLPS